VEALETPLNFEEPGNLSIKNFLGKVKPSSSLEKPKLKNQTLAEGTLSFPRAQYLQIIGCTARDSIPQPAI